MMKRILLCALLFTLFFSSVPAFAFYDSRNIGSMPAHDFSSKPLSGTILWSDIGGDNKLHYMHLETGDTGRFDLKGYHYLLYSDMPGAVVAREYDKNLSIFQMDLEGNLTLLLEPYLYTEAFAYGLSSLPATALAYYDGWLYYFLDFHYQDDFTLARTDGENLFVYRSISRSFHYALSPKGQLAWLGEIDIDDETIYKLLIQNPESGTVQEIIIPGEMTMSYYSRYPVWIDEDTLIFCGFSLENDSFPLYVYQLSTGRITVAQDNAGNEIFLPWGITSPALYNPETHQLLLMEYMDSIFVGAEDGMPFIIDLTVAEEYKLTTGNGLYDNRAVWYNE